MLLGSPSDDLAHLSDLLGNLDDSGTTGSGSGLFCDPFRKPLRALNHGICSFFFLTMREEWLKEGQELLIFL